MILDASHLWRFYEIHWRYHSRSSIRGNRRDARICWECDGDPEWRMRQKVCKSEASTRGLHLSKKTAYVKECMARMAKG